MHAYHITLGYYGQSDEQQARDLDKLHRIVAESVRNEFELMTICEELNAPKDDGEGNSLGDYVTALGDPEAVQFIKARHDDYTDEPAQYMLTCSGGGKSRVLKTFVRRAFCELVMRLAHREGFEININVV